MNRIDKYCEEIRSSAIKNDCWTCDCLQGFITQLLIDLEEDDVSKLKELIEERSLLHSCLGCDPCPPGELFTEYLKQQLLTRGSS